MFNMFQGGDDQTALIGCGIALFVSFGAMYVSFFIGKAFKKDDSVSATVRLPSRSFDAKQHDQAA